MSYSENYWRSDASILECTGWANPRNASSTIRKLQKIKFSYQEERNQVADLIDELNGDLTDCIYSISTRFPEKNFAPILCDEIQEAIKSVILNAAYRAPDVSDTNKDLTVKNTTHSSAKQGTSKSKVDDKDGDDSTKDNVTISSLSERSKMEKAQKAFYEAVKNLAVSIKGCTLNRHTFEAKFNLTWT
jgi:hypothetical protein